LAPFDTKARPPRVRNGLVENIRLLFCANEPGAKRVMEKPFCVPKIEVTRNSLPESLVVVNTPLPEMPAPLNEKSNDIEFANTLWVAANNRKRTATAGKILDDLRI
jgi:hypothetical protein